MLPKAVPLANERVMFSRGWFASASFGFLIASGSLGWLSLSFTTPGP